MIEIILNNTEGYRYDGPLVFLMEELNMVEEKYLELLHEGHVVGIPHDKLGTFKQIKNNIIQIEVL